jgi:heme-degrading monooxygenase HmoA
MFSVIFEVCPRAEKWDDYLGNAKMLRPELERVEGFIDNVRYKSLRRDGWILSLSGWRDEKSLVRWRVTMNHHLVQQKGRNEILRDYHLRVGQITRDSQLPAGQTLQEQRLDETETGEATTLTLIDVIASGSRATDPAEYLGLNPNATGLVAWDVFDAVLTPGDLILLISWRSNSDAQAFESAAELPRGARIRHVRVVRDYGMFDRREAPQYYPPVTP